MTRPGALSRLLPAVLAACLAAAPAGAQGLGQALQGGEPSLQLRLSYERADLDDPDGTDAATALNLRTRLGYRTGTWGGSAAFLQFQDVSAWIDDYAPEDADFDPVADPEATTVHQAYLENAALPGTEARAGRQEIVLGDARLIGNVGWRQHAQSFDAVSVDSRALSDTVVRLGYVWRVKTPAATLVDLEHLAYLRGAYTGLPGHTLSLIGVWLDAEGDTPDDRDKLTYGAGIRGDFDAAGYDLQYARQGGYADNSDDGGTLLNAFIRAGLGAAHAGVGLSRLTGTEGDTRAFDTLFSTAHKFNGWSDQFVATNGGRLERGLEDTWVQAGGPVAGTEVLLRYHEFSQETRGEDYGTEVDALVSRGLAPNLTGLLKAAFYTADDGNTSGVADRDETIYWVRLEYGF